MTALPALRQLSRRSQNGLRLVLHRTRPTVGAGAMTWSRSYNPTTKNNSNAFPVVRFFNSSSVLMKDYPPHTLFPMPALSPTMETGTIASWTKKEGEEFVAGDVICEIETDKATLSFEAQDDGILAKILREGDSARDIPVGTPVCVVVEDEADVAAFVDFKADDDPNPAAAQAAAAAPPPSSAAAAHAESSSTSSPPTVSAEFLLLPSARHLSESRGVDATGLKGSGKGGRITKGDVLQALSSGVTMPPLATAAKESAATVAAAAPAASAPKAAATAPSSPPASAVPPVDVPLPEVVPSGTFKDQPNNAMRKIIASRLTESKRDVPHFYTSAEIELDAVLKLRKEWAKNLDIKVSVNDFVLKACAMALRDVPEVNGTYNAKKEEVSVNPTIDVSVAVATPTGLITPIVKNIDKRSLTDITNVVRDLATRARDGKLKPDEYQGGTFTVSNLGMFGIQEFSAVINPPQAAILAVGGGIPTIVPTPYVEGVPLEDQPEPTIKTVMTARLSADRKVVDEPTAALFMQALQAYLSKPKLLMI